MKKIISLFSGCGGMDLGFNGGFNYLGENYEKHPFEFIYANEIDEKACETYACNLHHGIECKDITRLNYDKLPKADIVLGGFPCQDFSHAGKRKGISAERGQLYLSMKKVIDSVQPKVFIAENVDGIRTLKNNTETALERIIKDLSSSGYKVQYQVLNAASYGVPQNRKRVIIVGIRNDLQLSFEYPPIEYEKNDYVTSKQAIDDIWGDLDTGKYHNHSQKDYSKAKFYENRKMQGNCKILENSVAPTIRAEHHGNIEGHYRLVDDRLPDNIQNWRRLSVRECARLQSFPDDFIFPVSASAAYRQIGNAVPPVMAWYIARSIVEMFSKRG